MRNEYSTSLEAPTQVVEPVADILYRSNETGQASPLVFVVGASGYTLLGKEQILDFSESTTSQPDYSVALVAQLQRLFTEAQDELFEDGMESQFSQKLSRLIHIHAEKMIDAVGDLVLTGTTNSEVAAQALRWLGYTGEMIFRQKIRLLLERIMLQSKSAQIRDGALSGLGSINSTRSITSIERAIKQEPVTDLRQDMRSYLCYLKKLETEPNPEN